ncbi:hypothetical protein AB6D90_13995 [Vibrio splendidus]|jgi:hypothetical protein
MDLKKYNHTVYVPESLCLYDKHINEKTLKFFEQLEGLCKPDANQIKVDFSGLEFMSAAAANYLFAIFMYYQINLSNSLFTIRLPKNTKQRKLFIDSGLHRALKAGGTKKVKSLWDSSDFLCGDHADRTKLLKTVKERCGVSPFPDKLATAIRETFLNVHHHAYSKMQNSTPLTWFCYFYVNEDENGRFLSIVVQDLGQGMVNSIKDAFPEYSAKSDKDCIQYAMTKSVSSTHIEGRGKGSFDIQKPLIFNRVKGNDNLYVMSGSGCYIFSVSDENKEFFSHGALENYIRGTLVEWTLYY